MLCPSCQTENRTGRRFCAGCGAILPVLCPSCGFRNEAGARFCGGCGAPLGEAVAESTAPPQPLEGERRPVAVLFADLCGYTQLSRSIDPEDMHQLLGRYFQALDEVVVRYGGTVDKHIGDAVMAVFGAPVAHGDDAARAVRAAAEMHRAVAALASGVGRNLAAHIGIASGEVVASGLGSARHQAYTVIGQSVNLAARLVGVAKEGETVVDDAVRSAAETIARFAVVEGLSLKGIEAGTAAWRLTSLAADGEAKVLRPFVGRQGELAQLRATLDACRRTGAGSTLYVRGEAGIGKTRLIEELHRAASAEGFACHRGLVLDFGMAKGRDAMREIAAGLLALPPGAGTDSRQAALDRAAAQGWCRTEQRPFLADLLDLPQPADSRAIYEAMDDAARHRGRVATLEAMLRTATAARPVLLLVEDLHWADAMTLALLSGLVRAIGDMPVALVATSRVEGDPLDAAWRASVQGCPLLTLDLGPLGEAEARQLAGGLVAAPGRFAERCIARAAGNPLFLEQLLRGAEEHEDHLPASVHGLVLARMDRLPERDRAALRAAAVIGQRFPLSLVRHLSRQPDYDCGNLLAHFLVRPEGGEYLFAHALIRDGVYASLTKARRRELHRAAAVWFTDSDPVLRAEHLDRADDTEAPRAFLDAARAQAKSFQMEHARALVERGLALAREQADVFALNMLRGELHRDAGVGKASVAAYEAALGAASGQAERCEALIGIAAGHRLVADIDAGLAALAEAEPIADALGLARERAALHYLRGNLHFARGLNRECRAEHEAALRWARAAADPKWEARAESGLADADYAEGRMATAAKHFSRCLDLCEAHGDARFSVANRLMVGHCRIYLAEFASALDDMAAARKVAMQVGNRHAEMFSLQSSGFALTACADHAGAAPVLERASALAEELGARRYLGSIRSLQAEGNLANGQIEEARSRLMSALDLARETGMGFFGPIVLALLARVSADPAERERHWNEGAALLAKGCISHNHFHFYRYGIEDALQRRDPAAALGHAERLAAYTAAEPLPYSDLLIARARTLVAIADTPDDAALHRRASELKGEADSRGWHMAWPVEQTAPT